MLQDKVVLIAGGTGGIGSEIVNLLAKHNARVCIIYKLNEEMAKLYADKFKDRVFCYKTDISSEREVNDTLNKIIKEHSKIDIVIHAATRQIANKTVEKKNWEDFQENINVCLKGLYNFIKAMHPNIIERAKMIKEGVNVKFIIILTEYCVGRPPAGLSDYISGKYALMGFSKAMSIELAKFKCTVNMISPGMVNTKLISELPAKLIEITAENNPMKRIATPKDVAEAALFFASNASDYINGAHILVNGGNTMI